MDDHRENAGEVLVWNIHLPREENTDYLCETIPKKRGSAL